MILDEPVRGTYPEFGLYALSGLDQMRVWEERRGPRAPIVYLLGSWFDEYSFNSCSYSMPALRWLQSSAGVFPGSVLLLPGDVALTTSVLLALPAATGLATAQLSVNFVRAASPASARLRAHSSRIHVGRSLGLSDMVAEDERGELLAHGTSRQVVFPPLDPPPERPESFPPIEEPDYGSPDPYLREPTGEVLPQEVWDRMSGLEVCRATMSGELPCAPIEEYFGLRLTEVDEGRATTTMPSSEWFASALRTVYGGVLAILADVAMTTAVMTTVGPRTAIATIDLDVNFLRPVYPDGRDLTARASVSHRGKTLAVASAEILNGDGKRVLMAKQTVMVMPGRTWSEALGLASEEAGAAFEA